MILPRADDYIDIHTHGAVPRNGIFSVENILAHQERKPENVEGIAFTAGIHPWYLSEENQRNQLDYIRKIAGEKNVIAVGEAGFDRLRGPSVDLQRRVFEEQYMIAKENNKPLVIHCVKAWEELLAAHKKFKPDLPWLVHGFRGKKELGQQLIKRGMYLSFWFDFIIRPESVELIKSLPKERIFLETDGADISITEIYQKVSAHLELPGEMLKKIVFSNFIKFFKLK